MHVDVAIVGGGIIGSSIAYHAARRGARVALLEAGELGEGASGAVAGRLAAQAEATGPGPLLDLMLAGRARHRELDAELRELTGIDPGYAWGGTMRVATDDAGAAALKADHAWQVTRGLPGRLVDGAEAREIEPALTERTTAALWSPDDGQVNPPELLQALVMGAARHGAEIREFTLATGLLRKGNRVTGVQTRNEAVEAGTVVLAGTAIGGDLAAELGLANPVFPVKGELLVVHARPVPIRSMLWDSQRFYAVPKPDGRVIIGAVEQPGVRDRRPTLGGVAALADAAVKLVPALARAVFGHTWGGLRPGTETGEPILGPVPGWEGLLLASGHFRHGLLLSALTGEVITALAAGEEPPVDIGPFRVRPLESVG